MKTWLLLACLFAGGGEHEKGLALYRDGKFAEAAAAFRAAIDAGDDSAEIQFDLALASWRAAQLATDETARQALLDTAETAVEKYAALAKNPRPDLHRGLLGVVRHDQAKALEGRADAMGGAPAAPPAMAPGGTVTAAPPPADPLPTLEEALQKANEAKGHFVAGAARGATPELLRNTERTLRYIDELQKKIDELKKQREEQKKDDEKKETSDEKKDEKKDDEKNEKPDQKPDEPKPDPKDPQQKSDEEKDEKGEPKPDEPKPGDPKDQKPGQDGAEKPEPKPEPGKDGEEKPAPQPSEAPEKAPEPTSGEPRNDAPGEATEPKELTPEQTQRLLEQVKDLDKKLKSIRARVKSTRPPVERDW